MERYTNGKYVGFVRSRQKDISGKIYLIVGWEDGSRPTACWEEDFLAEYKKVEGDSHICENHAYSEKKCQKCGQVFCYNCCLDQNVDQGGKYAPDFMLCPKCGHDYYADGL